MKVGSWVNVGTESIPAYGLFRVTGTRVNSGGLLVMEGMLPDGLPGEHRVNKGAPVRVGATGAYYGESDVIHPMAVEENSDLEFGDTVGPVSDSALASPDGDGWTVLLGEQEKKGIIIARRGIAQLLMLIETTEDHDQGDTQNCYVLSGPKGAEERIAKVPEDAEDPYITIECFNRFSDLVAEQQAIAAYVGDGWELIAASCE